MTPMISAAIALLLTGVILVRVICVVYHTTAAKHAHPLLYLGFGYSYVVLGAGAAFAAVALVADVPGADDLALWLLLAGSVGLIAFDRRAKRCLAETQCPIETQGDKLG